MRCVVLADRHHGLSEAIRDLLEEMFEVIVMVADEPSLMESVERMPAEVAVVDLSLTEGSGPGMVRRLRSRFPDLRLVAMSVASEPRVAEAAFAAGADAFVAKSAVATELLPTMEALVTARRTDEADACHDKDGADI